MRDSIEPTKNSLKKIVDRLKENIIHRGELPHISVEEQLNYLDELSKFSLGQVLLEKGSIDTFWTDFILTKSHNTSHEYPNKLENFILNRSPFILAWRELLEIFQKLSQENLKDGIILASIPCGAMKELLELNYAQISNFKLIGIDIEKLSLMLAKQQAVKVGLAQKLTLYQYDAWKLPFESEIDIITSCGLNIYISNPKKVLSLYKGFFKALRKKGKLILGFLTYPPGEGGFSEWKTDLISSQDLLLERILYKDLLNSKWRNFRTSEEISLELKEAGFSKIKFYYDRLHVFPVVTAIK